MSVLLVDGLRAVAALALVLVFAWASRLAARVLRQPEVVGEMLFGLLVGPVLLTANGGALGAALLPAPALALLKVAGHFGLALFLVAVAHELQQFRHERAGRSVGWITVTSFGVPLLVGTAVGLGVLLTGGPDLRGTAPASAFVVFVAVAFTITAVPVLARILADRGLEQTRIGRTAMAASVATDAFAWLLLAVAVALASGRPSTVVSAVVAIVIGLAAGYALRFVLHRIGGAWQRNHRLLVVLIAAAAYGGASGIHELGMTEVFGALLVGLALPSDGKAGTWTRAVGSAGRIGRLLIPVFFVVTGLTVFSDLSSEIPWVMMGVAVAAAIIGKVGGGYLGAWLGGEQHADRLRLGVLLNTRGLTELVVLQAGYSAKLITAPMFLAFAVMAVVTTMMTGPWYAAVDRRSVPAGGQVPARAAA